MLNIFTSKENIGEVSNDIVTTPNIISILRGVGGVALGAGLATNAITPSDAATVATALAISDMEGSLIRATKKFQNLQKWALIKASKLGEKLDHISDKVCMAGVIIGGLAGGQLPGYVGGILATEVATVGSSARTKMKTGNDPVVGPIGKAGMIMRFTTVPAFLLSDAAPNNTAETALNEIGHTTAIGALALGALSVYDYWRQGREQKPEQIAPGIEIIQQSNNYHPNPVAV